LERDDSSSLSLLGPGLAEDGKDKNKQTERRLTAAVQ
jgi:hypothetical protein